MQKTASKFIWSYLREFKLILFLIIFFAIIARLLFQYGIWYMAKLFDFAASEKPSPEYWRYLFFVVVVYCALELGGMVFQALSMWFGNRLVPHLRSVIIKNVFAYVNKHSISYFTNEMAGNISNKFNQLQSGVVEFLMQSGNIMFEVVFLLINLVILSCMDWILSLSIIIWMVIIVFLGKILGSYRAELSRKTSTEQSQANAMIVKSLIACLSLPIEKSPISVDGYGNTTSASIPLLLSNTLCGKNLGESYLALLSGFGGGLSWGTAVTDVSSTNFYPVAEM